MKTNSQLMDSIKNKSYTPVMFKCEECGKIEKVRKNDYYAFEPDAILQVRCFCGGVMRRVK